MGGNTGMPTILHKNIDCANLIAAGLKLMRLFGLIESSYCISGR